MDYNVIIDNLPLYLSGLWVTIQLVVMALVAGFGLAIPLALMAVSKNSLLRYPAKTYIYFFRGTPLLVQMFMLYHGMGQFEAIRESVLWIVFKEAYWCAITAFALNTAAYTAEIPAECQNPRCTAVSSCPVPSVVHYQHTATKLFLCCTEAHSPE